MISQWLPDLPTEGLHADPTIYFSIVFSLKHVKVKKTFAMATIHIIFCIWKSFEMLVITRGECWSLCIECIWQYFTFSGLISLKVTFCIIIWQLVRSNYYFHNNINSNKHFLQYIVNGLPHHGTKYITKVLILFWCYHFLYIDILWNWVCNVHRIVSWPTPPPQKKGGLLTERSLFMGGGGANRGGAGIILFLTEAVGGLKLDFMAI